VLSTTIYEKHEQPKLKDRRKIYWNKNSKISLLLLNMPLALEVLPLKHCRCERSKKTSLYQFLGDKNA
jgi:hypothetical protein